MVKMPPAPKLNDGAYRFECLCGCDLVSNPVKISEEIHVKFTTAQIESFLYQQILKEMKHEHLFMKRKFDVKFLRRLS